MYQHRWRTALIITLSLTAAGVWANYQGHYSQLSAAQ